MNLDETYDAQSANYRMATALENIVAELRGLRSDLAALRCNAAGAHSATDGEAFSSIAIKANA